MKSSKEIIAFAMNMEKQGQKFYESFADQVDHPEAKKWFEVLAETEREHYEILEKQYEQLDNDGTWLPIESLTADMDPGLFESRSQREQIEPGDAKHSLSDLSVLRMAYLIENDFAEFYKKAMDQVSDEVGKQTLRTLFEWENEHRRTFYNEYRKAMESNWFEQGFFPF
ncbi:ferritin family protein [Anoxynatronum sibiricum]|uniref:Ferritin family protein n=1 Tax=Anoxynatronum sibiricum TaxID=210623 RepID=A0ABU9VV32_9CLOT